MKQTFSKAFQTDLKDDLLNENLPTEEFTYKKDCSKGYSYWTKAESKTNEFFTLWTKRISTFKFKLLPSPNDPLPNSIVDENGQSVVLENPDPSLGFFGVIDSLNPRRVMIFYHVPTGSSCDYSTMGMIIYFNEHGNNQKLIHMHKPIWSCDRRNGSPCTCLIRLKNYYYHPVQNTYLCGNTILFHWVHRDTLSLSISGAILGDEDFLQGSFILNFGTHLAGSEVFLGRWLGFRTKEQRICIDMKSFRPDSPDINRWYTPILYDYVEMPRDADVIQQFAKCGIDTVQDFQQGAGTTMSLGLDVNYDYLKANLKPDTL